MSEKRGFQKRMTTCKTIPVPTRPSLVGFSKHWHGVLIGVAKISSVRREKALGRLFEDERYRRALDLIRERTTASTEDEKAVDDGAAFAKGFEDAVNYLNGEGVPADQARENLVTMIDVIAESQQQAAA